MNSRLGVGLVGLGKIAKDQHIPAIASTDGIELVAIASRNATLDGVRNFGSLGQMLEEMQEVQAVILCQPPQVRFEAACEALVAGRHVFLEKPPGATLSEVDALVRLANERGLSLFASWHSREGSAVCKAREWIAKSRVRRVRATWKEDVRVWHPGQDWIWQAGGFGVFDPGINALSILTSILPEPVRVVAAELEVPANCAAPIAATLTMRTSSGLPVDAEFDFRQTGPQSWDICIEADEGRLVLGHGGNSLIVDDRSIPVEAENEYIVLYRKFVACVSAGVSDVDPAPLKLVADAFMCGQIRIVDDFFY